MEKYSLVQRLGQGSFAVVWKARRKQDGRLVAVKQLRQSPESWEACKQLAEVRSAAAINDRRHVVQLLEAVRHGGELFLVFEYIEGNLHHCAAHQQAQGRRLEEPQVRWAAKRLLSALAAVHAAGLVHCDVKPENILVGAEGGSCGAPTLKLCDFGQATAPDLIGTYVGTRWYRAPELLLGARGDVGVDLWAAGCTLAELFLARPLFPGSDMRDMFFRISGELGAPDDGAEDDWPLAAKMIEMSGRANASASAWGSLAEAGASEAHIALLRALLQYNTVLRWRASRALREAFFAPGLSEWPIEVPPVRPPSPETLRRQRDEATVVERRLRGNSAQSRGSSPAGLLSTNRNGEAPSAWERSAYSSWACIRPAAPAVVEAPVPIRSMQTSASATVLREGPPRPALDALAGAGRRSKSPSHGDARGAKPSAPGAGCRSWTPPHGDVGGAKPVAPSAGCRSWTPPHGDAGGAQCRGWTPPLGDVVPAAQRVGRN